MKDVRVLSIFEAENPGFNSNLHKNRLEIIEELEKEPRQKIENLAKKKCQQKQSQDVLKN